MSEHQGSLQPNSVRFRKWSKYLILSLPIIISFFQIRILDNDFYFLYSMGKYIVNHGFPYTDVLSMHSNMKIVVQQWLSSVIFYFVYNLLGKFGVIALVYISNICICILTYRYISLVTNNTTIADSIFEFSVALERGGVISAHDAYNATISDCKFDSNVAAGYIDSSDRYYGDGGTISWINGKNLKIINSEFNDTQAHAYGGSLYIVNVNDSSIFNERYF